MTEPYHKLTSTCGSPWPRYLLPGLHSTRAARGSAAEEALVKDIEGSMLMLKRSSRRQGWNFRPYPCITLPPIQARGTWSSIQTQVLNTDMGPRYRQGAPCPQSAGYSGIELPRSSPAGPHPRPAQKGLSMHLDDSLVPLTALGGTHILVKAAHDADDDHCDTLA